MTMPTTLKALQTSLYWQEHVARASTNPEQKARCQRAIERLKEEIANVDE